MGKGIILYQSKYGATKKYAEWLQDKTGYDCVETKKASITQLHDYDTIVLGISFTARANNPPVLAVPPHCHMQYPARSVHR
ncbi:MAG: flavodoxin domain-containing protein [Lachnospiraceae bacterium]|nr:flavodoxin domain-containing protein [Lachnospiraceae bacterium]